MVVGGESDRMWVDHLHGVYPIIRAELEDALGWPMLSQPRVLLVDDADRFEGMTGNPLIAAFAIPSQQLVAIHLSPDTRQVYTLNQIFRHELCHLLLHDHVPEERLPRWLDEGVCQWLSGSLGEILASHAVAAAEMNVALRPIPIERLDRRFPQEKNALLLSYEVSRRFVEHLVASYGRNSLLGILQELKEGSVVDEAVSRTLGKPLSILYDEWLEEMRGARWWLLWVSRNLDGLLFLAAALLTVVAFVRIMVRKRFHREYSEDEEQDRDSA